MTEYECKSIIIGRKKDSGQYGAFVGLSDVNDPHKQIEPPKKILDFMGCRNVKVSDADFKFLISGGDFVINDLEKVDIEYKDQRLHIKCTQKKNASN